MRTRALAVLWASVFLSVFALTTPAAAQFLRGDFDGDGSLGLPDVIGNLNFQFIPGSPEPDCLDAADVNDDGVIGLPDPLHLANFLFIPGSPPPAPPYPDPGPDPTPGDPLGNCGGGPMPLDFETIAQGTMSGAPEQTTIIREQAEWEAFWEEHTSFMTPQPPLPPVDFTTEMVVIVLRHFGTGGYFVNIDEITDDGSGTIEVHFTQGEPIGGCPVILILTQPHHIVRVTPPAPGDPEPFETVVDSCP